MKCTYIALVRSLFFRKVNQMNETVNHERFVEFQRVLTQIISSKYKN